MYMADIVWITLFDDLFVGMRKLYKTIGIF